MASTKITFFFLLFVFFVFQGLFLSVTKMQKAESDFCTLSLSSFCFYKKQKEECAFCFLLFVFTYYVIHFWHRQAKFVLFSHVNGFPRPTITSCYFHLSSFKNYLFLEHRHHLFVHRIRSCPSSAVTTFHQSTIN